MDSFDELRGIERIYSGEKIEESDRLLIRQFPLDGDQNR
jgi:hypothetical protein